MLFRSAKFLEKQPKERRDFLIDLNKQTLTADERREKLNQANQKLLNAEKKFIQKRQEIIEKQAEDRKEGKTFTDGELKEQITNIFKELF